MALSASASRREYQSVSHFSKHRYVQDECRSHDHGADSNQCIRRRGRDMWHENEHKHDDKQQRRAHLSKPHGAVPLRFLGYHFQGADLSAMDFSSSFLIAADLRGCRLFGTCFLGTDLRDADLKGADLRDAFFLTQMQINAAKGSRDTRLPSWLKMPDHWESGR